MADRHHLEAIVFDMDGTLLESQDSVPDAYIAAVQRFGGPNLTTAEVVDAYPLGPPARILERLIGRAVTNEEVDDYYRELEVRAPAVHPYEGIREVVAALSRVLPVAVFTGASVRSAEILLGGAGLLSLFRAVVGGNEVHRQKPNPDGLLLACERLGVSPKAAAYVGDSPTDLEAARRAEAIAVAAGWGHLYKYGAAADIVLQEPADLLALTPGQR